MFSRPRRSAVIAPLLVTALAIVAAPAGATEPPPIAPGEAVLPDHQGKAPRATALLSAGGNERMITLRLSCRRPGRITVSAVSPKRRLGTTHFACRNGRAVARMRMSARAARGARQRGGLDAVATIVSAGERSRFDLKTSLTRDGHRTLLDVDPWYVPPAWCTGIGFTMSVDNTTRFSANYGEQVWWRPIGYQYDYTRRQYSWQYPNNWRTHRAVPGDGGFLINADGSITLTWTVTQSAALVVPRYNMAVRPAFEVYTARGGYESRWLGANVVAAYEEIPVTWCVVPDPA